MSLSLLLAAAAPAIVVPAAPDMPPAYRVSYHPRHGIYCLRNNPDAVRSDEPTISGRECRREKQWARAGLTFSRRDAAVPVVVRS